MAAEALGAAAAIALLHDVAMEVVRLGAWCDLVTEDEHRAELAAMGMTGGGFEEALHHFRRAASFRVSEFAVLADGGRLTLHDERGFSSWDSSGDQWRHLTLEGVEADVRTTVLPDEDDTDDEHPWNWLVELLLSHGITTSADRLRLVPYEVEFSERLLARLTNEGGRTERTAT